MFLISKIKRSDNLLVFFPRRVWPLHYLTEGKRDRERKRNLGKFLKTGAISSEGITGRDLSPFGFKNFGIFRFHGVAKARVGLTCISLVPSLPAYPPAILQLDPAFYFYTARLLPREKIRRMNPKWVDELERRWKLRTLNSRCQPPSSLWSFEINFHFTSYIFKEEDE